MTLVDKFNLVRFVTAQTSIYEQALHELRAGRKRTHWMWFIFPQVMGLGNSARSRYYAISGSEEATAYLDHQTLGPRLISCTTTMLAHSTKPACEILGRLDTIKLQSCMTLFDAIQDRSLIFDEALSAFFNGERDTKTLSLLEA